MHSHRTPPLPRTRPASSAAPAVKVMVVDDSLTVRTIFSRMITSDHKLELAATAKSGEEAIEKIAGQAIDVILLDLEMPGMGGLKALPQLLDTTKGVQILVVSSLTDTGAEHTLRALAMGAADTMLKPRAGGFDEAYRITLLQKIQALGGEISHSAAYQETQQAEDGNSFAMAKMLGGKRPEVLAFGASTGGIHALTQVLKSLPSGFRLPIVITQHLPATFVPIFARQIEMACNRRTNVAKAGEPLRQGEIMIASGEGHLTFYRSNTELVAQITSEPAPSGCMPSVDPMLSNLAHVTEGKTLAVILSGMGRDGVYGAKDVSDAGGTIFTQDAETSAVWGMPGAVTKAGLASACLPPEQLAEAIIGSAGAMAWR